MSQQAYKVIWQLVRSFKQEVKTDSTLKAAPLLDQSSGFGVFFKIA